MTKSWWVLAASAIFALGCSSGASNEDDAASSNDQLSSARSFRARGTGYYPDSSALEGGFVDRQGKKLRTLQDYLAGRAEYVSVAMDVNAFKYGTHLRIHQLETKYGRAIDFRVVDTGGAFRGKGTSRIDICTKSNRDSLDPTINGMLDIDVAASAPSQTTPAPAPTTPNDPPPSNGGTDTGGSSGGGEACNGDGDCNPGNDGSGKICTGGQCVPGCRRDYHCPGSQTCVSGMCQ